jgi:hypothetical protein
LIWPKELGRDQFSTVKISLFKMCLGGGNDGDETGAVRNREIDKMIRADEKKMAKEIKLLLLGRSSDAHFNNN